MNMQRIAKCFGLLATTVLLNGCEGENEVSERRAIIQPDGSGILSYYRTITSTNAPYITQRLNELADGEDRNKLIGYGFFGVEEHLVENISTQAVVRVTAHFDDWYALAKWIFSCDLPTNRVFQIESNEAGLLFYFSGNPDANAHYEDPDEEAPIYLTISTGNHQLLESNADAYDENTGELHWSLLTIDRDGMFFRVRYAPQAGVRK